MVAYNFRVFTVGKLKGSALKSEPVNDLYKKVLVHREGAEYGPYDPLSVCEMLHKGQLHYHDQARMENGNEWKSLETLLPEVIGRIVVLREGTEYGPYDPYLVGEMMDKGELSNDDRARLEDGSDWKSLRTIFGEAFDRSFTEMDKGELSKRSMLSLLKLLPLIYLGYLAYRKQFVENEPVMGGFFALVFFFLVWGWAFSGLPAKRQ